MDIRKRYTEETGKLYYKEAPLEFEWDDNYVEWLEQNLVKLFAIPAVSKCERFEREALLLAAFLDWLESISDNSVDREWIQEYFKWKSKQ